MKDPKYVYVTIWLDQVGDTIVPIHKYADVTIRDGMKAVTYLWKLGKHLRPLIDRFDCAQGGVRIVGGNVIINVLQPLLRLCRPCYLCHVRILRFISSLLIVR